VKQNRYATIFSRLSCSLKNLDVIIVKKKKLANILIIYNTVKSI